MDAYHEMLGIPPDEQPPHHYRLLGIALFEASPEVISNAASRQMRFVRDAGVGAYSDDSQRLLNEIATAKVCLLNPEKRRADDAQLRARLCEPSQLPTARSWGRAVSALGAFGSKRATQSCLDNAEFPPRT